MFIFFAWVIWISLLIMILVDNFRRTDQTGWAKAGWTLFVIFLPLVGVLVYMIARPADLPTSGLTEQLAVDRSGRSGARASSPGPA